MIAVIVPFTRPQFQESILNYFNSQSVKDKMLIVVENGSGLNSWHVDCDMLITCPEVDCKSKANNVGIAAAKNVGADYFAIWDDDDFYGPSYLEEVSRCSCYEVTGIERYVYQSPSGDKWVYPEGKEDCKSTGGFLGGTLAGKLSVAPDFYPIAFSEEILWCRDAHESGLTMYARKNTDFVYCRVNAENHKHTFPLHLDVGEMVKA